MQREAFRHAVEERLAADEADVRICLRLREQDARRRRSRSRGARRSTACGNSVAQIARRRRGEIERKPRQQRLNSAA